MTLLASSADSRWCDPLFWIGAGSLVGSTYFFIAATTGRFRLPTPYSIRAAENVKERSGELLAEAQELYHRRVRTEDEFDVRKRDQEAWLVKTRAWIENDVSDVDATDLDTHQANFVGDVPHFNEDDKELRRQLNWQMQIVRGIRHRYTGDLTRPRRASNYGSSGST